MNLDPLEAPPQLESLIGIRAFGRYSDICREQFPYSVTGPNFFKHIFMQCLGLTRYFSRVQNTAGRFEAQIMYK